MKCEREAKAVIYSSFVIFSIDTLLTREDRTKGSVIKLRQNIAKELMQKRFEPLISLSNKIWIELFETFSNKNMKIVVSDFIEFIVLENSDIFTEFYSKNFVDNAWNASFKVSQEGVSKEILASSREVTNELFKIAGKKIYDYCKGV